MKHRLGDVCDLIRGTTGIKKAIPGTYPLVTLGENRGTHNEFQFDSKAVIVPLISSTGHGHASMKRVHYQEGKFALGSILCAVIPKDEQILSAKYLHIYLNLFKDSILVRLMKGAANVSLPIKKLADVSIPVPEFNKQIEIVELVEEVSKSINQYDYLLINQLKQIHKLGIQILQDAIQGNLVPQDPNDEPASKLLEKIKAEKEKLINEKKLKKSKPLPPIKEEEIPFDIPDNWVWCRLGNIASVVRGGSPRPAGDKKYYDGDIPFLKVADLTSDEKIYLDNHTYTIKKEGLYKTRYVDADTLMLTNSGATLGIPKICSFSTTFNDGIAAFLGLNNINKVFLYYFLKAKSGWFLKKASRGQGQPNLNTDIISQTIFALPPLKEQQRIVKKINELLKVCNELENEITQNQSLIQQLLQSALKEALEPK